jgi:hypothetical protein
LHTRASGLVEASVADDSAVHLIGELRMAQRAERVRHFARENRESLVMRLTPQFSGRALRCPARRVCTMK